MDNLCIICLKTTDNVPKVFDNIFDTRNSSSQITCVYSRIFNVEEHKFVGNFNPENITFCTDCSMHVMKLTVLCEQLELIEKSIKRVVNETKIKILLSKVEKRSHNASHQAANNRNDILMYDYFRNQAIKDLNPTVNLQRLSKTITSPKSIVDLRSNKSDVKKGSKCFDDSEGLLLVKNDSNTEILDIKTETIDDAEENINESQENNLKGLLLLERPVIARNLADTVKTRTRKINKDAVDYGEETDAADDDYLNYSTVESDAPESEISDTDKKSYKDGIVSLKKNKTRRLRRDLCKGVDYTLKNQPNSAHCTYQCKTCSKQFPNERHLRIHIRRVHLGGNVKLTADGKVLTHNAKRKRIISNTINLGGGKWSYKNFEYTKDSSSGKRTCVCVSCGRIFDNRDCVKSVQQHINNVHGGNVKLTADGKVLTHNDIRKRIISNTIYLGRGKWSYKNFEYTKDNSSGKCKCACVSCGKIFDNRDCVRSIQQHINTFHGANDRITADGKVLTQKGKVKKIFSCKSKSLGGGKWSYKNFEYTKESSNGKCKCECDTCGKIFDNRNSVTSILQHINTFHGANDRVTEDGKVLTQKGKVKKIFSSRAIDLGGGKWSYKNFEYTKDSSSGKCICVCNSCGKIFDKRVCIQSVHQHIKLAHVARLNTEYLKKFTVKGKPRKPHLTIKLEGGERWCNGMQFRIEKDPEDSKKRLFHCGMCDYVCGTAHSIKRHISMKHLNPGSRICYICEEIFPSKNSYDQHVSSHDHTKSATCEECGETFKYRAALYPHIRRVHLGERPYICEFCGKRFFTRKDCRVHSATHNNVNNNSKQDTPEIQNTDSSDLM